MARFASGGPSFWKKTTFTVNASSSTDIFSQDVDLFRGLSSHVSIYKSNDGKLLKFDYSLMKKNNLPEDTVFAKNGDIIDVNIDSNKVGSDLVTTITNNESNAIVVNFYHLTLV